MLANILRVIIPKATTYTFVYLPIGELVCGHAWVEFKLA